jgi:hypothetical protein
MAVYEGHGGEILNYAQGYRPFDIVGAVDQALRAADQATERQLNMQRVQQQIALDDQLAPLRVMTAKLNMDRVQKDNQIFDLEHTPDMLQAQLNAKKAKLNDDIATSNFNTKMTKHKEDLLSLQENGTFSTLTHLAENDPMAALDQVDRYMESYLSKNPLAVDELTRIQKRAKDNINSGNFSMTLSEDRRDANARAQYGVLENIRRSQLIGSGKTPDQVNQILNAERKQIYNQGMATVLEGKLQQIEVAKLERTPAQIAALQAEGIPIEIIMKKPSDFWHKLDLYVNERLGAAGVDESKKAFELSAWNDATDKILQKVSDNLVSQRGNQNVNQLMLEDNIRKIKALKNNWGWLRKDWLFDTEEGKIVNDLFAEYKAATTPEAKQKALVKYAEWIGSYSMDYNEDLLKEQVKRARAGGGMLMTQAEPTAAIESFPSVDAAKAAGKKSGDRVVIGGQPGTLQ